MEQYADDDNGRCVVKLFRTYLLLIPQEGDFYKRPIKASSAMSTPRFSSSNVGLNTLKQLMQKMFKNDGIDTEGRNITGHSGKVTCVTQLFTNDVSDKMVRGRTGHTSGALEYYKRPNTEQKKAVSDILQPPSKRPSVEIGVASSSTPIMMDDRIRERFKHLYHLAKSCGSKSIKLDVSTMEMAISID